MTEQEQNGKRKHKLLHALHLRTLRQQLAAMFILVLLLSLLGISFLNGIFLEKYYLAKKVNVLLAARNAIAGLDFDSLFSGEGTDELTDGSSRLYWDAGWGDDSGEIGKKSSLNNLSFAVIDRSNSYSYTWGENDKWLRSKLFGYIYNLDAEKNESRIIRTVDNGVIQQVHDKFADMDYVECWGGLDNGYYYLIRTPLESIRESASISNTFYFFAGMIGAALGGILVIILAARMARPIDELTRLAGEMADLNFDARYESCAGNEIDQLGDSFNKMSRQLEHTISELKAANLELQKDIENKIKDEEQRKEFLDNVSHELKTPLALIQGYAEGLKENINDDPESMDFYCEVIIDEAGKMNKLVKSLLTLNQLESGHDPVVMERFDIVALIKGVLSNMDILISQKEAKVHFADTSPVYVWGDEFKIEEVVTNYMSNALNHLGGDRDIEIRLEKKTDKTFIYVFNNGSPIPEEDLPNLWNKFYKVDKARTREYDGSGIGLSIVKAIMESMNQAYGVKNYNNGVEFYFSLDNI